MTWRADTSSSEEQPSPALGACCARVAEFAVLVGFVLRMPLAWNTLRSPKVSSKAAGAVCCVWRGLGWGGRSRGGGVMG